MTNQTKKRSFSFLVNLGKLWLDKTISRLLLISVMLTLIQAGLIILSSAQLPPQVPLFYSLPWGKAQLAPFQYLFLLPILSLACILLNTILAMIILEKKRFLSLCLVLTGILFSFFSLISLIEIILTIS